LLLQHLICVLLNKRLIAKAFKIPAKKTLGILDAKQPTIAYI